MQTKPFCMGKCINNIKVKISAQNSEASGKGTARERDKEKPDKQKPYTHTCTHGHNSLTKTSPFCCSSFFAICVYMCCCSSRKMAFSHLARCVKIGLADFPSPFCLPISICFDFAVFPAKRTLPRNEIERERAWSFHNPLSLVLLFTPAVQFVRSKKYSKHWLEMKQSGKSATFL